MSRNQKSQREKVEKTQQERDATKSMVVSEKWEGGQIANEFGFGSTEQGNLRRKMCQWERMELRDTVRQREREMQKEKWVIWVGSGLTGIQGWQHFGGGVWWFRSPPARGASVSGGGPDHELLYPPRATATNPFSPPPFTTSNHHRSNPKPTGNSASLLLLLFI